MVRLAKRIFDKRTYYYLEHSVREGGKRKTRSKYLGREIPKNLDEMKEKFAFELDRGKWFKDFGRIKRNYEIESSSTPKSAREKELQEFAVRFTYDTQRIEGSTLTLRETAQLLEDGITPSGKPIRDVLEAEAHRKVFFEMLGSKRDLSLQLVQEWHWELFKETKPDIAGRIRKHGVRIAGSRFVPPFPVELQPLLHEFFGWYNKSKAKLNAVELAALVHLKFVTVHPFSDGNGRISRLMMNFVLHRHGYPMLNIEYLDRAAYYNALERSQISSNERRFLNWFFRRYRLENRIYLTT